MWREIPVREKALHGQPEGINGAAFEYGAEGHLVKVCEDTDGEADCDTGETVIAAFTYDGDGKRVRSDESGVVTAFVGTHYEVQNPGSGETVTKYYYAGATRIASRKYTIPQSMAVEYLFGDHLGSASITTDTEGDKVSEIRYKPWGEVRYAWTDPNLSTTPAFTLTKYTFTGQFSYMDDPTTSGVTEGFGWMYYNARWYDPVLGRFNQADTIIPGAGNVQAWDRYAYARNNPVKYIDPSGHSEECALGEFGCRAGKKDPEEFELDCNVDINCDTQSTRLSPVPGGDFDQYLPVDGEWANLGPPGAYVMVFAMVINGVTYTRVNFDAGLPGERESNTTVIIYSTVTDLSFGPVLNADYTSIDYVIIENRHFEAVEQVSVGIEFDNPEEYLPPIEANIPVNIAPGSAYVMPVDLEAPSDFIVTITIDISTENFQGSTVHIIK